MMDGRFNHGQFFFAEVVVSRFWHTSVYHVC